MCKKLINCILQLNKADNSNVSGYRLQQTAPTARAQVTTTYLQPFAQRMSQVKQGVALVWQGLTLDWKVVSLQFNKTDSGVLLQQTALKDRSPPILISQHFCTENLLSKEWRWCGRG